MGNMFIVAYAIRDGQGRWLQPKRVSSGMHRFEHATPRIFKKPSDARRVMPDWYAEKRGCKLVTVHISPVAEEKL